MRRHTLLWLSALSLAVNFGFSSLAVSAGGSDCQRFDLLQPRPSWLFSGGWVNDGTELILPDTIAGRLLRYRRSGTELRPMAVPRTSVTFNRPGLMNSSGKHLVI